MTAGFVAPSPPLVGAELWLDDLYWHKKMFRQSRFQWAPEHAMDIVMRRTGGALDYETVGHLSWLQDKQNKLTKYLNQCLCAMDRPLHQAQTQMSTEAVKAAVGLSAAECVLIRRTADGAGADERTNRDVRGVLHRLPFVNPLLELWELKQLWRLFQAADNLVEDTVCDLLLELMPDHSEDRLWRATGAHNLRPELRVEQARRLRGASGDPRRRPQQRF